MDPIDEERSAEEELLTPLQQKLLLHGVLRRKAAESPVANEGPDRYFLKGDNYMILFVNMISWISYILFFTAPGASWVPTSTQIAATVVMTVWEAINDDFAEDLSDQDSSFDENTLQEIKSLREKYPKFAEVVIEMICLYRHHNKKHLTKRETQFLKLLCKLKEKMQDSIEPPAAKKAKAAKADDNFHMDSLGNLYKIRHDTNRKRDRRHG